MPICTHMHIFMQNFVCSVLAGTVWLELVSAIWAMPCRALKLISLLPGDINMC